MLYNIVLIKTLKYLAKKPKILCSVIFRHEVDLGSYLLLVDRIRYNCVEYKLRLFAQLSDTIEERHILPPITSAIGTAWGAIQVAGINRDKCPRHVETCCEDKEHGWNSRLLMIRRDGGGWQLCELWPCVIENIFKYSVAGRSPIERRRGGGGVDLQSAVRRDDMWRAPSGRLRAVCGPFAACMPSGPAARRRAAPCRYASLRQCGGPRRQRQPLFCPPQPAALGGENTPPRIYVYSWLIMTGYRDNNVNDTVTRGHGTMARLSRT